MVWAEGNNKLGHLERTVDEPRDLSLHHVTIKRIDEINSTIRLFRLEIHETGGIKFLPGQWLDVYVPDPSIPQAGGFTITCSPSKAIPTASPSPSSDNNANSPNESQYPYLELAIQQSPLNPVASWLWQSPLSKILNKTLKVRVGGSFVFPPFPPNEKKKPLNKVIFIAGGVGVNPLMSMLSYIGEIETETSRASLSPPLSEELKNSKKLQVHFLYSVKDPNPDTDQQSSEDKTVSSHSQILFLKRISNLFSNGHVSGQFKLFLTQPPPTGQSASLSSIDEAQPLQQYSYPIYKRRISKRDIASTLGPDKDTSAVYICGVPAMTDSFVELLTSPEDSGGFGMATDRVLFEKWW
ncbi:hypothetical protein V8F20_006318 [Naviculisporaceae sp. PSN 640]